MAQTTNLMTELWKVTLPDHENQTSPALALDGTVYQGTFRGWLFAIAPSGDVKWKFKAGREIWSSPAVAADGTIYFGARDWNLYALSPDGKLKWKFATGGWVDASPALAVDGTIYFASWDRNFYALSPDGKLKWKFATGSLIVSSPAIAADGTIYFGSHDKNFYALSPDGKLKWKFATGAPIQSSPAIGVAGTIYFTSTDGNLYALNPDGSESWHLHTGGYTGASPILDKDENLCLGVNYSCQSFTREGKIHWQHSAEILLEMPGIVTANDQIFFSMPWRSLGLFQTADGNSTVSFPTEFNITSGPNLDANGNMYVCDGHTVYALRPANPAPLANSSWPMWRADPQHTGRAHDVK